MSTKEADRLTPIGVVGCFVMLALLVAHGVHPVEQWFELQDTRRPKSKTLLWSFYEQLESANRQSRYDLAEESIAPIIESFRGKLHRDGLASNTQTGAYAEQTVRNWSCIVFSEDKWDWESGAQSYKHTYSYAGPSGFVPRRECVVVTYTWFVTNATYRNNRVVVPWHRSPSEVTGIEYFSGVSTRWSGIETPVLAISSVAILVTLLFQRRKSLGNKTDNVVSKGY